MATYVTDGKGNKYERKYDSKTGSYTDHYAGKATGNESNGNPDSGSSYKPSSSGSSSSSGGVTKTSNGYAYTDKYGFTHVVSDYNTAKQYSGNGNVYDYNGSYDGGYARGENGARLNLPIPGATSFSNGNNDISGGGEYLGGISKGPAQSYNNYVYNAAPTATAAMASKYTAAPSTSGLLPLRDTFASRGYGVDFNNGLINIKDSTGNVLGTFDKGAYTLKNGQAYFDPSTATKIMSLTAPQPAQPSAMPTLSQQQMPVPTLDMLQPFQYQPYQMPANLPQLSSGGDAWMPTLSAKQQWYGQQDALRGDYLDKQYKDQVLAQQQAAMDWEKEIYNSPYEKALRDLSLQQAQAQLQATQALEAQRTASANRSSSGGGSGGSYRSGSSGGGSGYSSTTLSKQTADGAQQLLTDIAAGRYTPGDAIRKLQDPAIRRAIQLQGGNPDAMIAEIENTYVARAIGGH